MKALITIVLLIPATLQAQTLPGSSDLDDSRLAARTWEVTFTMKRDGQSMKGGTTKYELARLPGGRWAYMTTTTSQLGTAADTSIMKQGTLEPISHRSHAVPRTLSLDFDGTRVTGAYAPRDSTAREIERVTEVPAFDAAVLEIVLGSLPLAAGYTTRLPMYIEERDGLVWFDVTAVSETEVGSVPAWEVRVAVMTYNVSYFLARDDHRVLAGRVEYPNGATVEMTIM
jgi:hypothetical protein